MKRSIWLSAIAFVAPVAALAAPIAITNAHEFGNGAVIYTRSGHAAHRFIEEVEAGMQGVNHCFSFPFLWLGRTGLKLNCISRLLSFSLILSM